MSAAWLAYRGVRWFRRHYNRRYVTAAVTLPALARFLGT